MGAAFLQGTAHADLKDGLILYYPFNGSIKDESGRNAQQTVYGAELTDDRFGAAKKAIVFSPSGKEAGMKFEAFQPVQSFTLATWFNAKVLSNWHPLFEKKGNGIDFGLMRLSDTKMRMRNHHEGVESDGIPLHVNSWHHVAFTYDHGKKMVSYFYDGIGVFTRNDIRLHDSFDKPGVLYIADGPFGAHEVFDGKMDEVRIYNRPLAAAEIQEIFKLESTKPTDSSSGKVAPPSIGEPPGPQSQTGKPVNFPGNLARQGEEVWVLNNSSKATVHNNPPRATTFTIKQPTRLTALHTYHWNNGKGQPPGQLSLRHEDGTVLGPWSATAASKTSWLVNCVPTDVHRSQSLSKVELNDKCPLLKPGTYTIINSSPETWSHNSETQSMGFTWAKGVRVDH
ncbi:MAG: LamG domain-containing protein [Magnetococcus sp. DMHC-1]|nr:LamG domain-containing protein [Magnetococcales bacterium]